MESTQQIHGYGCHTSAGRSLGAIPEVSEPRAQIIKATEACIREYGDSPEVEEVEASDEADISRIQKVWSNWLPETGILIFHVVPFGLSVTYAIM